MFMKHRVNLLAPCTLQATFDCINLCLKIEQGVPLLLEALKLLELRAGF
jgi:hypothetical protein